MTNQEYDEAYQAGVKRWQKRTRFSGVKKFFRNTARVIKFGLVGIIGLVAYGIGQNISHQSIPQPVQQVQKSGISEKDCYREEYRHWDKFKQDCVSNSEPIIGMSKNQLIESWGEPNHTRMTETKTGVTEIFKYDRPNFKKTVTLKNGTIEKIIH